MKLRIEKAIYGGAGLARIPEGEATAVPSAGKAVFVPMTIPGELVEAHITEDRTSFANAELDSILEAAPSRTTPGCLYYGVCGGCQYQHVAYPQQLEIKAAILLETLQRAGVVSNAVPPIHTLSGEPWAYRNRIRLRVRPRSGTQPATLCYRERGSHTMLPIEECPIAAPQLVRALQAVQRLFASPGPSTVGELCDEVEFFTNKQQDAVLLSLSTASGIDKAAAGQHLHDFCTALQVELPELSGAAILATEESESSINKANPARGIIAAWGEQAFLYSAAGFDYRVGIGSFFQVNRFLIDGLVDLVTGGRSGNLAWDLYAGVGLFARALTSSFRLVRAVESSLASCADLRHNLKGTAHKIVESSTLDFLRLHTASRSTSKSSAHPDLVVLDPPRAGLGTEVTTLLGRLAPHEIVYVSCDPATLARDLRALLQSGYQIQSITMVDLFPQTFHLESVSRLSLR